MFLYVLCCFVNGIVCLLLLSIDCLVCFLLLRIDGFFCFCLSFCLCGISSSFGSIYLLIYFVDCRISNAFCSILCCLDNLYWQVSNFLYEAFHSGLSRFSNGGTDCFNLLLVCLKITFQRLKILLCNLNIAGIDQGLNASFKCFDRAL